jgi:hypothetical protein
VQASKFQDCELTFDTSSSVHAQSNAVLNNSQVIQRIHFVRSGLLRYLCGPNRDGGREDWRNVHKEWF